VFGAGFGWRLAGRFRRIVLGFFADFVGFCPFLARFNGFSRVSAEGPVRNSVLGGWSALLGV